MLQMPVQRQFNWGGKESLFGERTRRRCQNSERIPGDEAGASLGPIGAEEGLVSGLSSKLLQVGSSGNLSSPSYYPLNGSQNYLPPTHTICACEMSVIIKVDNFTMIGPHFPYLRMTN